MTLFSCSFLCNLIIVLSSAEAYAQKEEPCVTSVKSECANLGLEGEGGGRGVCGKDG